MYKSMIFDTGIEIRVGWQNSMLITFVSSLTASAELKPSSRQIQEHAQVRRTS